MWIEKKEQRLIIYQECLRLKREGKEDIDELWKLLDTDVLRFCYCKEVKDRKELWSKITSSEFAYCYCLMVKDREELWSKIDDNYWAEKYCEKVMNRPEVKRYAVGKIRKMRPEIKILRSFGFEFFSYNDKRSYGRRYKITTFGGWRNIEGEKSMDLFMEILRLFGYSKYICSTWRSYPSYVKHVYY